MGKGPGEVLEASGRYRSDRTLSVQLQCGSRVNPWMDVDDSFVLQYHRLRLWAPDEKTPIGEDAERTRASLRRIGRRIRSPHS